VIKWVTSLYKPIQEGGRRVNRDFIQIKSLEGELKLSHKKFDYGLTVSTKELVLQKPHVNYIIKLEDIFSISPFDGPAAKTMTFHQSWAGNQLTYGGSVTNPLYKMYVLQAVIHNRSGIHNIQATEFIIPIHDTLLEAISKYSGLGAVAEKRK
jgi:hypothetical protein